MIKLTDLILENNLREYSDEEKRKMGIPSGATSRGGKWYVGDKYAGKVVGNKFVAAAGNKKPTDATKTKTSTSPSSTPTGTTKPISKDSHKNPEVYNKVLDVMDTFKVNQDGNGGQFVWIDDKQGGYYEYDDNEDGYDYYAKIRPLNNDEYDVTIGNTNSPVRVKGLDGVKKHLEGAESSDTKAAVSKPTQRKSTAKSRNAVAQAMQKNGYKQIGQGESAVAFVKDDNEVVKIIVPKSDEFQDEDKELAEKVFDDFYKYSKKHKDNKHLPRFFGNKKFTVNEKDYKYIAMEKLDPITPDEEDLIEEMVSSIENNEPLPQTMKLTDSQTSFYKTLRMVMRDAKRYGHDVDILGDEYINVMRRGKDFVIMDPWA